MKEKYNSKIFWEERFSKKLDLTTVGQIGLGYVYNSWLYRARFHAMRRALRKLSLDISQKSLIDIGVGCGAWIPFWQKHSILKIVGIDITSASICALKKKYPQFVFIEGDISSQSQIAEGEDFDIVTAIDVLFHITDDKSFSSALLNISKLVKDGGWVIMSDSFCSRPWGPFYHEYHRSYDDYLKEFDLVGLRPFHVEPIFYTMTANVSEFHSGYEKVFNCFTKTMLSIVGKGSCCPQTEWMNHLIGCSLYLLDNILCKIKRDGYSLKLLFAQKK